MTRYSVQPRDRIFVKDYGLLSSAKNMGRKIDKNMSRNLGSKYSQKLLDHAKKSAINAIKTASIRGIQKQKTQLVIWLAIKLLIKLQDLYFKVDNNYKSHGIYHRIVEGQLQMKQKILNIM